MKNPTIVSDPEKYKKGWHGGLPETPCGYGSKFRQTAIQRKWIPEMVSKYGIKSIADIGAGDMGWISKTELGCKHQGYDLVKRHKDVIEYDLLTDPLPAADCLMVLWVANHLPPDMQEVAINKLKESKARYLLMTWDKRMEPCTDLPYIEKVILRHSKGVDFELRLIRLC